MVVERGSAVLAIAALSLLVVTLQCEVAQAATYEVGDHNGWAFYVEGWEKGKTFKAGDVLVFKYQQGSHNVVVVNKKGYDGCSTTPSDKVYTSGNDKITLEPGLHYFICGFSGHCASGMKLQISVS